MTERALEAVLAVDPGRSEQLVEPERLGDWLGSAARVDDSGVAIVVEEEYGYRRRLRCDVVRHEPGRVLELQVREATREWDGSDGTPVGPAMAAASWEEPALVGTTLCVVVEDGVARLRWSGFGVDALDAVRREGTLVRHAVDRATDALGPGPVETHRVELELEVTSELAWSVLDDPGRTPGWLGDGAVLATDPGCAWTAPVAGGSVGGRILLAIAGRRLVGSWHEPGIELPTGMLDVRLLQRRGEPSCSVDARLDVAVDRGDDMAAAWLEHLVAQLATESSARRRDA